MSHRPLLLALSLAALCAPAAAAPLQLPPPWSSGAGAGLLGPAPAGELTGGHLRGTLALSAAGTGAPLLFDYRLSASGSFCGWAELGATLGGRWLSVGQHEAAPVELWLRAGPRLGRTAVQGIVEVASGRGGFDLGGAVYPSTTTLGALAATDRGRFSGWLSLAYQAAGPDLAAAEYRGLQLGAALWVTAVRDAARYHLQLGAEGLARLGWRPGGPPEYAAIFSVSARLVDEHGAAFSAGGGKGLGALGQGFGAMRLGWSFGPRYHYPAPAAAPLLEELSDWLTAQWASRTRPGFGPLQLPPPALHWPPAPPFARRRPLLPPQPRHCDALPGLPARGAGLALRTCTQAWDLGREGPAAPSAGPAAPQEPSWPPMPPGALAGPPPRAAGPRGAPRGPLRTGRGGAGYTDPDTRAQAEPPARTPPTVWTGGRPGPATMGPADVPPPPPSIPIRPQPPGPLPQGMRPSDVPPFLRPPPPPAQTAEHLAPMAPPAPTPRPSSPPPAPAPPAAAAAAAAPTQRPARVNPPRAEKAAADAEARDAAGNIRCTTCGVVTTAPTPRARGSTVAPTERQYDHIIPVARGGGGRAGSRASNIQVQCAECNREKRDRYVQPWVLNPVPQTPRSR